MLSMYKANKGVVVVVTPSIGEKLVAKPEFNNTMDKQAVKVVKGDETVGLASSPEWCGIFLLVVEKSVLK